MPPRPPCIFLFCVVVIVGSALLVALRGLWVYFVCLFCEVDYIGGIAIAVDLCLLLLL